MAQHQLKQISIDELTPGMYVVGVDVPWYRTPFLTHKRLIQDPATIDIMRQCGIRMVTIDPGKGKDTSGQEPNDHGKPTPVEETASAWVSTPSLSPLDEAHSAQELYAAAEEAIHQMFDHLMQGGPPSSSIAKATVTNVMRHLLINRDGLMTQVALRKIKRFDQSLAAHSLDTCILALAVSVEYGLDHPAQLHVGSGALLHDAGYVRLPRNLVRKRHEEGCTEEERTLLRQHPSLGLTMLAGWNDIPDEVTHIIRHHHERLDGSGFPDGLAHTAISPLAQIVGIVDWYDGMVSRRGGRPAMLPNDAVRRLFLSAKEGRFEPTLVETTVRVIGVYPIGSLVLLNTGEQAIVVGLNTEARLKPKVLIIKGPRGEAYVRPQRVDLAAPEQAAHTIVRVLDPAHEFVNIALYLDDPTSEGSP
jgi:HD-GYP domain-containing protein (c-di-GMP phosphodiesterase class II)